MITKEKLIGTVKLKDTVEPSAPLVEIFNWKNSSASECLSKFKYNVVAANKKENRMKQR